MGWNRYREAVKRGGWGWYESEVPPSIVKDILGVVIGGRSYSMSAKEYRAWVDMTGMDMLYGYVPWQWGRVNGKDEWGRLVYQKGVLEVGDLVGRPPYEHMHKRLEGLCAVKGECGVEFALYNTPQVVMDGLGFEKFCYEMADRPKQLKAWMERVDERVRKELEVILEYPVEVVQVSQPMCDKNGPMFGSDQLYEFHLEFLERRVARIHEERRLASLHCDGNNQRIFDRLTRIGIDIFNGYDGPDFEADYEKTSWGWRGTTPTALLESGTPEQIRAHVSLMKPQVIGSEDMWEMPTANFVAMMEAARVRTQG